jgi:hypothetical protein
VSPLRLFLELGVLAAFCECAGGDTGLEISLNDRRWRHHLFLAIVILAARPPPFRPEAILPYPYLLRNTVFNTNIRNGCGFPQCGKKLWQKARPTDQVIRCFHCQRRRRFSVKGGFSRPSRLTEITSCAPWCRCSAPRARTRISPSSISRLPLDMGKTSPPISNRCGPRFRLLTH